MGKRKEITSKDNGKQKMWIIITVIIVFFAMAGYAGMSYYYSDRFFRGTTINGINCSGKTSEEAEQAVAKKAEDYLLEVKARNLKSQSINGKLIGYRYVSDGSISQYLDEQKPYKWVQGFWKKQNYTAKENMIYDKVKLKEQLEKLECVKKENQIAPEDAYVAYKDSKFEIIPETEGNVDLSAQHLYYYQDGSIILESDIVSGDMQYAERQTPSGIFQLYYKKSPSVLKGKMLENGKYEYERPVTYWMPFNGGIGFHDASWQPYFGGNRFREGGGSHGCINLPADKAAELYNRIDESVPIVCFY